MSDELIVVEKQTAIEAFENDAAFEELYAKIVAVTQELVPDVTTSKGRNEIRSLAAKIPKVKTAIKRVGEELIEDWVKKTKNIKTKSEAMADRLDELRDQVRKPLTDWEIAEEERIKAIKGKIELARELARVPFGESSAQIQARMDKLPTDDLASYGEFKDEAQLVIENSFNALVNAKAAAVNAEKQAKELEDQKAEMARMQEIEDARRREADAKAEQERKERAEAERKAEEERLKIQREREAFEAEKAEFARKQQEEADRVARQQADEQRRKEEAERREKEEAARKRLADEVAELDRIAAEEKAKLEAEQKAERERVAELNRELKTSEVQDDLAKIFIEQGHNTHKAYDLAIVLFDALLNKKISHVTLDI